MISGYDDADSYTLILKEYVNDIWNHLPPSAVIWVSQSSKALSSTLPWLRVGLQTKLTPEKIKYMLEVLIKYVRDASKSSTFPKFQSYLRTLYPQLNDVLKKLVKTIRLSKEPVRPPLLEGDNKVPCKFRPRSKCMKDCHWDLLSSSCAGTLSDDSASSSPRQHHDRTAPEYYDISTERLPPPPRRHSRSRANNNNNDHAWLSARHY